MPWRNCGSAGDAIAIQKLDASVWPPQAGKPLTLSYGLTLSRTLTDGSFERVRTTSPAGSGATWTPFQLPVEQVFSFGLTGHRATPGGTLPLPAGPYSRSLTLSVPSNVPVGSTVTVNMVGHDVTGHEVVCMQLVIPFK